MDRAQAIRLVAKLLALGDDRAATEAEKALARVKAEELSTRFRLGVAEQGRPRLQARRRYRARRAWVMSPDPDWDFHRPTRTGSRKVRIEHHWGDWQATIEIGWWTSGASWRAVAATGRSPVRRR